MNFSPEQIISLAPDPASAKAGRGLASIGKWVSRGADEKAIWGECQGSGKDPYRTQIDLSEPAFRCSCPSRKFPCKHGLGLFLLYANQPAVFAKDPPPPWVSEWLAKRASQAEQKKAVQSDGEPTEKSAAKEPKNEAAKLKRAGDRQARVTAGLAELELWLVDLMRRGLGSLQSQPDRYWHQIAARLVDAQAPGLARRVRELSGLSNSVEGWTEIMLARLGSIYLLLEGFKRIETLPSEIQADIRSAIGWTIKEEELSSEPTVSDKWIVLGQRTYEEEGLVTQPTWLWGQSTGRNALALDFAAKGQALKANLIPGTGFDAELVFFPGNSLRVVIRNRLSSASREVAFPEGQNSEAFLSAYADFLGRNPWAETFPVVFDGLPVCRNDRWFVRDSANRLISLSPRFSNGWELMAVSGGHVVTVSGEWDGLHCFPFGVWNNGQYLRI